MLVKFNTSNSNGAVLQRQLEEYNFIHKSRLDIEAYSEYVFLNGLLSIENDTEAKSDYYKKMSEIADVKREIALKGGDEVRNAMVKKV